MTELDPDEMPKLQFYFLYELSKQGFREFTHIGDGGQKRAYSAYLHGKKWAIKVIGYADGADEREAQETMIRILGGDEDNIPECFTMNKYYNSHLHIDKVLRHYQRTYPGETPSTSNVMKYLQDIQYHQQPLFIYEISPFYDITVDLFFAQDQWNWKDFRSIFCQIIDGLRWLQSKGVSFTDFKLNNVMLKQKTRQVYFIDYFNSPYQCSYTAKCRNQDRSSYTFYDIFHARYTFQQDVWRVGFSLLYSIERKKRKQTQMPFRIYKLIGDLKNQKKECDDHLFGFLNSICGDMKETYNQQLDDYFIHLKKHLDSLPHLPKKDKALLFEITQKCMYINELDPYTLDELRSNPFFASCPKQTL